MRAFWEGFTDWWKKLGEELCKVLTDVGVFFKTEPLASILAAMALMALVGAAMVASGKPALAGVFLLISTLLVGLFQQRVPEARS